MIASQGDRRRPAWREVSLSIVLGAFVQFVAVIDASAQTAEPLPAPTTIPADIPQEQTPQPQPLGQGNDAFQTQNPGGVPLGVTEEVLTEITADGAGVLSEEAGGLGPDLWMGTDRATVEALLPRLPVAAPSKAMRDLSRRLLMTLARPPLGLGTPMP